MARIRSPNYPAISLAEAIKRIDTVHAREHQHPTSREVLVKGMGYSGLHGTSLGALSAAIKFGLLAREGKGEDYRVTDRAVAILHPHNPAERTQAIREAAHSPQLFREMLEHFKGELPGVIQAFRETMELVPLEAKQYPPGPQERPVATPGVDSLRAQSLSTGSPELGTPPLGTTSVSIQDDRILVSAVLISAENVQRLIDKLSTIKGLLPSEGSA
jgi:hypothetical protein